MQTSYLSSENLAGFVLKEELVFGVPGVGVLVCTETKSSHQTKENSSLLSGKGVSRGEQRISKHQDKHSEKVYFY